MATPSSIPPRTNRFDIFRVSIPGFPQVDHVIVLTNDEIAAISTTTLVVPLLSKDQAGISSSVSWTPATRVFIKGGPRSLHGFKEDCYAAVDTILTVPKRFLVSKHSARLHSTYESRIEELVQAWLGFADFPVYAK